MSVYKTLRHMWWSGARLAVTALGWGAFAVSRFDTSVTVLADEVGETGGRPLGPRVVVFCHFDAQGRIRDHTRAYIDALCAEGLAMVFVTNAGHLLAADLAWIRARAARVVIRRNIGYDFAAWRDGLARAGLPQADTELLLIANDSVYGPLRPLGPALAQIDFAQADVWGATDSWQHRFHLQSFFVAFGPRALQHEAFARFWGAVRNVRSKWWVVRQYELGLSRIFIAGGLRCRALWPYTGAVDVLHQAAIREHGPVAGDDEDAEPALGPSQRPLDPLADALRTNARRILGAALRHVPLNPTADLWQVLLAQGCPFIKRELLQKNPSGVPDVAAWSTVVGGIDGPAHDLILRDLERSLRNRTP